MCAGCRFYRIELPQKGMRRRIALRRAVWAMKKNEVHRCVFPVDFPEEELFRRSGIGAVDVAALMRRKAGEWTLIERQARGLGGSVAISAERVTAELTCAVLLLLERVPYVLLQRMTGAEELQKALRRESGAVLRIGGAEQITAAETLLDFGNSSLYGQVLTLRPGKLPKPRIVLPREIERTIAADTDRMQMAAALWEAGKLRTEEIGLKSGI